jgi:hypothetical protein
MTNGKQHNFHRRIRTTTAGLAALLFGSCLRELSPDDGRVPEAGNLCVEIRWERQLPTDDKPSQGMRLHLFPVNGGGSEQYDRGPSGGTLLLPAGQAYYLCCYDYWGHDYLNFRREDDREGFEVYHVPAVRAYNTRVETGTDEPAVMEPYPYAFYVGSNGETFEVPPAGTDTIGCYPKNVLREFTFLIWGLVGIENVAVSRGAVSGMAGAYFPATGRRSATAATILFRRTLLLPEGRLYGWDTGSFPQQVPVGSAGAIPVYPAWFPSGWEEADVWTGDWIVGAFSTFGPVDAAQVACCLTVEVYTRGKRYYSASWGYRPDEPEDPVGEQLAASLGAHGTIEEQQAWRRKNGGFDIVLDNGGRLLIPPDEEPGLDVDVSDWGDIVVPLKGGINKEEIKS